MKRLMTASRLSVALLFIFALGIQRADAQATFEIGPKVGYEVDRESAFLGADIRIGTPALPVKINPYFDYYFTEGDNLSLSQFGANALYEFGIANQTFTPYAGAGLAITRASYDRPDITETDAGLNLLFGARFGFGQVRPFAQAQVTVGSPDFVSLAGGVLFRLGQ